MSNPFSSSQTTKSNQFNQGTSVGTSAGSFSNPALNNFQSGLMQNISQGMAQANQPLYGQAQISQYLNSLNGLANSSIQNLQGNLARRGVGGASGQLGQGLTDINLARQGQAGNFISQLPMMNRQASLQASGMFDGLGNQLMSVAPRTQTSNQFTQGTGTGYQKQTMSPSIMSDIGQSIGIAGGLMGMPGLGGGGGMPSFAPPSAANSSAFAPANTDISQLAAPQMSAIQGGMPAWMQGMQPNNLMWNQPQGQPWYNGGQ